MRIFYRCFMFFMVLTLMCACKSVAQNAGYIELAFPKKVEERIWEYVQNQSKIEHNGNFYLVLNKGDEDVYEVFIVAYEVGKEKVGEELSSKTNRYLILGTNRIPVIYYMDYYFAVFGRVKGKPIRKITIHEGYSIKFKYNGDIIENAKSK